MEVQQNVFEIWYSFRQMFYTNSMSKYVVSRGGLSPSGARQVPQNSRQLRYRKSYSVIAIQESTDLHDNHSRSVPESFVSISKDKKDLRTARFYVPEFEVSDEIRLSSGSMNNVQQVVSLTENLVTIRDELRLSLINKHGLLRARRLYERHVKRSHYLLINAEEDDEKAAMVRTFLEDRHDRPSIKGRWNIVLGSQRLADWEHLMQSATTVLVFLSRALCRDEILSLTFPSVFMQGRMTVPLYLEYFTHEEMEREFRSHFRPVVYSYGITLHDRSSERIKEDIDNLHARNNFVNHYSKEIAALQGLLHSTDSCNICPCSEC